MPGSYPDPRSYADTALHALEQAYEENQDSHLRSLILAAIEAITSLKQEIENSCKPEIDPYELNEHNSAV